MLILCGLIAAWILFAEWLRSDSNSGASGEGAERVRTLGGAHDEDVATTEVDDRDDALAALADAIRAGGYDCASAVRARHLELGSKDFQVFKVSCGSDLIYQVTLSGHKSFVKPWSGNLFGD